MPKSIEATIEAVAKSISVGIHLNIIKWALVAEGLTPKRADLIMAWAKQSNLKEKQPETITVNPDVY
jgi:hypothetical protein